jgi:uncharacterized membrane protein YphA (DoxX/SURF4 family)
MEADMRIEKMKTLGYWVTTALLALDFLMGGVMSVARPPEVLEGMSHLGYPVYFAVLLGVWKILGAVAIVAPRLPRLKEWAYAGIVFDLTGAAVSHAASGDGAAHASAPLVLLALAVASWSLRPASRALRAPAEHEVVPAGASLAA